MISTIFFDVDNTLLDFTECSKQSMAQVFCDYGLPFDEGKFETFTAMNDMLWQRVERSELTKDRLFEIRWNMIFERLGINGIDGRVFERDFHKYLNVSCVKVQGAEDALSYLSGKYKVYVASNAPKDQQPKRMRLAGLDKYIDGYFISETLGAPKPDKRFYDACFAQLKGVSPCQTLMIGDSLSADIDGARDYGMKTCWFNRAKRPALRQSIDFTIEDLRQLKDFL